MNFSDVLKHAGMMLLWWVIGGLCVIIGGVFLWNALKLPVNFFLLFIGIVIIAISVLAIWYGTRKYELE